VQERKQRKRYIHPYSLRSDGYKSAMNDSEIISSSSSTLSMISSVSDPKGYRLLRVRGVPNEEGEIIIPTKTTREVLRQMVRNFIKSIFKLTTSQLSSNIIFFMTRTKCATTLSSFVPIGAPQ
jgi:hypothetical protein